jgi:hypothetical protein
MRRILLIAVLALVCSAGRTYAGSNPDTLWIGADPFNSSTGILNTDRSGTVLRTVDPFANGGFANGIAIDLANNKIYFGDVNLLQAANLATLANIGGPLSQNPSGSLPEDMTFVGGVIWRTDAFLQSVNEIDPATNKVLASFSPLASVVNQPVGIAWDGHDLWIGGFANNRVEKFTTAGVDTGVGFSLGSNFVGQGFSNAGGLAYDTTDNTLWIGTGNRVYHYDLLGDQLGFFNTPEFNTGIVRFVDGLEFEGALSSIPEPSSLLMATLGGSICAVFVLSRRGRANA